MPLDINKLTNKVYNQLLENASPNEVHEMTLREAFDRWLTYEGIIHYTDDILEALEVLKQAEITPQNDHNCRMQKCDHIRLGKDIL